LSQPSPQAQQSEGDIVAMSLAFEGGLGIVALFIGWLVGESPWWQIHWRAADVAWGVAATLPLIGLLLLSMRVRSGPLASLQETVKRLIGELFRDCSTGELALISTSAGFGEELLFRGIIQHYAATPELPGLGIGVAAVAFGLAHPLSLTYFVVATLIGAYLGWLALLFDNLLVPIIVHGLYDFVAMLILLRKVPQESEADASEEPEEAGNRATRS